MNRISIAFAAALAAFPLIAENTAVVRDKNDPRHVKKISSELLQKAIYKKTGGQLKAPGSQKGAITIVNAAKSAPAEALAAVAADFAKRMKVGISVADGSFDIAKPEVRGEATLFVVEDASLPMSLVAPEARWALVNVAPLRHEKAQFFAARVRKEAVRALAYLCGAANSQYPNALSGCITRPEDLDRFESEALPVDVQQRFQSYLEGYGITPYRLKSYRLACTEGWAPQPTNDVQKAIWDEVHSLPTNPIEIKYDPKRDK